MKYKIKYKNGLGINANDGTKIKTTIAVLPNGDEFEFPTNAIDRLFLKGCELNYPLYHLKNIRFSIAFTDIKRQSSYADNICVENINDNDFIKNQMDNIPDIIDTNLFMQFNATSVGNIAYISIYGPKQYQSKANDILVQYKKYIESLMNKL